MSDFNFFNTLLFISLFLFIAVAFAYFNNNYVIDEMNIHQSFLYKNEKIFQIRTSTSNKKICKKLYLITSSYKVLKYEKDYFAVFNETLKTYTILKDEKEREFNSQLNCTDFHLNGNFSLSYFYNEKTLFLSSSRFRLFGL